MSRRRMKNYKMDMCNGPILSKMLSFALPLMCSSVLQLLFNAADIIVVGRFAGDNSLAAVGSNTALIGLVTNLFLGLSIGANVLTAKYYGAKDKKSLSSTVHTSILISIISGIILTVIGVVGARKILVMMQTPDEVLDLAATYLRIYFLGMIPTMLYDFGSAILRGVGDTKRPLYYLMLAGVVNIVLNLFFVIVLKLDVAGVAIATVISQSISACLIILCLNHEEGGIHLNLRKLAIDKGIFLETLRIGLPAGFQGVLFSISNVIIQSSVNSFGATVMAGNSAAANVEQFVYFAMNAFYQSTISFTSQNYGAGKHKRIYKILLVGQACVTTVGVVFGNLAYIFGGTLLKMYTSSDAVIAAGVVRLGIVSKTYALCGIMDVMVGALRGIGYSIMPMIISLIGACVFRIVWLATVFRIDKYHTVQIVYDSYPISWIITTAVLVGCFMCAMKRVIKKGSGKSSVIAA